MVAALGHLPLNETPPISRYVRLPPSDKFLICDDDMVFVPAVDLGDAVKKGNILGHGRFIDRVGMKPRAYFAPHDGWVLCLGGKDCRARVMWLLSSPQVPPNVLLSCLVFAMNGIYLH